jgi:hypothetical protein
MTNPPVKSVDNCLTPDDAEEFWAALSRWQGELSLTGWRITPSPTPSKYMAEMAKWDWKQRQVSCRLGLNWKATPVTHAAIEQTAVHELLHVLLYPLIETVRANGAAEDILAAEHAVINTLERLLVPDA